MFRRALLVGIDDYAGSPLQGCVRDVERIGRLLERHADGSPNFQCKTLVAPVGSGATVSKPKLRQALEMHFSAGADLCLFHFSGHGYLTSLGGYLVTTDAKEYEEGISMRDVLMLANASPVFEVIILLDCCHSGALGQVDTGRDDTATLREGVAVLTASCRSGAATEASSGGLFTSLLCAGLEGQASDLFGRISISSLYAHLQPYMGAYDERPRFRANLQRLTSLRNCEPWVALPLLRELTTLFPRPDDVLVLDPSYEPSSPCPDAAHTAVLAKLQIYARRHLVEPVSHPHMYLAAMGGGTCRLTSLGQHCWHLVRAGRV